MTHAVSFPAEMRRQGPDGLQRMVSFSLVVHVGLVSLLFVLPRAWFVEEKPEIVRFSIDLGGAPGEKTSGMTPAPRRDVQQVAPEPKRPTPVLPASPPKPSSVVAAAKTPPKTAPTETLPSTAAVPRPPTTGAQIKPGAAVAETGSTATQTTGLTLGGDAGGSQALDNNFCCPAWAQELKRRIFSVWNQDQPESGRTEILIEIRKDGSFGAPEVVKSSGSRMLDIASRAVFDKERLHLEPLPDKYIGDTLKVRLIFEYKR